MITILVHHKSLIDVPNSRLPGPRGPAIAQLVDRLADALKGTPLVMRPLPADMIDEEDFIEEALRVLARVSFARRNGLGIATAANDADARYIDLRTFDARTDLMVASGKPLTIAAPARTIAYGLNKGFLAHAGRDIELCRNDEDGPADLPSLAAGLKRMRGRNPKGDLIWKQMTGQAKAYPVERVSGNEVPDDIAWSTIHMGGVSAWQECVFMIAETRLFVVGNKIVSGAAAIEAHTPLDRAAYPVVSGISARFESRRGGGEFFTDEALAGSMRQFGEEFVYAIHRADPGFPDCYTLDLFVDARTLEIGIVELNPIAASGLYANDVDAIIDALGRHLLRKVEAEMATPVLELSAI